jgi:hypothetical protein
MKYFRNNLFLDYGLLFAQKQTEFLSCFGKLSKNYTIYIEISRMILIIRSNDL